jgi:hypothetical protein
MNRKTFLQSCISLMPVAFLGSATPAASAENFTHAANSKINIFNCPWKTKCSFIVHPEAIYWKFVNSDLACAVSPKHARIGYSKAKWVVEFFTRRPGIANNPYKTHLINATCTLENCGELSSALSLADECINVVYYDLGNSNIVPSKSARLMSAQSPWIKNTTTILRWLQQEDQKNLGRNAPWAIQARTKEDEIVATFVLKTSGDAIDFNVIGGTVEPGSIYLINKYFHKLSRVSVKGLLQHRALLYSGEVIKIPKNWYFYGTKSEII